MLQALFSGLSGLLGFSKGLSVISNNVANLNTPGFKDAQLQFQDLFYQYQGNAHDGGGETALQLGDGVTTDSTQISFKAGDLRQTGNDLDAAIDGYGFFILRNGNDTYYTRDGEFKIDSNGYLVSKNDGARLQAGVAGSVLQDINIDNFKTIPPRATTEVKIAGNLNRDTAASGSYSLQNIDVYDAAGTDHKLTAKFINNSTTTAGSWLVDVSDGSGTSLGTGEIRFNGDGSLASGYNTVTFSYAPSGVSATSITLNFGAPNSFTDTTSFSGQSQLTVQSQNGYSSGALTKTSFDSQGYLTTTYSNGQTTKHQRLALAWFNDLQLLKLEGNGKFVNPSGETPEIGSPDQGIMGKIVPQNVELSNVKLTEQFTDMIIIQRGYQASSQVISVTNQMMQQLLNIRSGK